MDDPRKRFIKKEVISIEWKYLDGHISSSEA